MVVVAAAEVAIVAGVVTGGFGLGSPWDHGSAGGSATPPGPSPNPYGEKVAVLAGSIRYTGNASGYFAGLASANLCGHCPMEPTIDWNRSPVQAVVKVLFNVTNTGSGFHELTGFNLSAAVGNESGVFELVGIFCCAPNNFAEDVDLVGVTPGQTLTIEAFLAATQVPDVGPAGFDLTLAMASSE